MWLITQHSTYLHLSLGINSVGPEAHECTYRSLFHLPKVSNHPSEAGESSKNPENSGHAVNYHAGLDTAQLHQKHAWPNGKLDPGCSGRRGSKQRNLKPDQDVWGG
jgi:hypothetical protein